MKFQCLTVSFLFLFMEEFGDVGGDDVLVVMMSWQTFDKSGTS